MSDKLCLELRSQCCGLIVHSGDKGIRTLDPLLARQVLSQLSYTPIFEIFNFKKFQIDIGLLFSI